jgi:hypothetical protein
MKSILPPLLAAVSLGCQTESTYLTGVDLSAVPYPDSASSIGIHPDTSVLDNPDNPFRYGISGNTKWDILDLCLGASLDSCVATFYGWATQLAIEPMGENQFYTAEILRRIFERELVSLADLPDARDRAIEAYQAVLNYFPESSSCVTETCESRYYLGPLAYYSILDLGGTVEGGWFVVQDTDGVSHLMRSEP